MSDGLSDSKNLLLHQMVTVKKLSPEEYRSRIENQGCPNCGQAVDTRGGDGWSEWRCGDPTCPESDGWHNIYEDLADDPF
jgi:hypothetical protein